FDPEPEGTATLRGDLGSAPRWLGLLPYEATRALERSAPGGTLDARAEPHVRGARWWRFGAVAEISNVVRVIGDEPACVSDLCRLLMRSARLGEASVALAEAPERGERHRERVQRALELIRAG